jgi:hypothetical protein
MRLAKVYGSSSAKPEVSSEVSKIRSVRSLTVLSFLSASQRFFNSEMSVAVAAARSFDSVAADDC